MPQMIIALGANIPGSSSDPRETLESALRFLADLYQITPTRVSQWYTTPAVPAGSGPAFVNSAALLDTSRSPEETLAALHAVEAALGRTRDARWAPRSCDLDLIAAGDRVRPDAQTQARWVALGPDMAQCTTPEHLILPHPRLQERAFVLVPLLDIAPDWRHPVLGLTVAEMAARLPEADRRAVRPLA